MYWENFKMLCEEQHLKPNNVAKELKLGNSIMTYWKDGKMPKGETLILVADYFDVSIDWLLDRTENRNAHKTKPKREYKIIKATNCDGLQLVAEEIPEARKTVIDKTKPIQVYTAIKE